MSSALPGAPTPPPAHQDALNALAALYNAEDGSREKDSAYDTLSAALASWAEDMAHVAAAEALADEWSTEQSVASMYARELRTALASPSMLAGPAVEETGVVLQHHDDGWGKCLDCGRLWPCQTRSLGAETVNGPHATHAVERAENPFAWRWYCPDCNPMLSDGPATKDGS